MAPADTPGRKKRETNYFEVGIQGRRTGIQLKDSGIRDEFGIEPVSGIFSSPAKQAPQSVRNRARYSDGTLTTSEDMDVGKSSAPEPTEVLSARRVARPSLPASKTPIRTNLGATPRRAGSVGLLPSIRGSSRTPGRAATHSPVRRLDYSIDEEAAPSVERSPPKRVNGSAKRRDVFDLPESPETRKGKNVRSPLRQIVDVDEDEVLVNGTHEDDYIPQMDGDDMEMTQEEEVQPEDDVIEDSQGARPLQKGKRGRKRKSDIASSSQVVKDIDEPVAAEEPVAEEEESDAPPVKKRKGRQPKNAVVAPIDQDSRPAKRTRRSDVSAQSAAQSPARSPAKPPAKTKKAALSKKDANKKGERSAKSDVSATDERNFAKPAPRGVGQRERHVAPSTDNPNMLRTKSGRLSYKPLANWKGEKVVFEHRGGVLDIHGRSGIAEIVRIEDATPIKRPLSRHTARPSHQRAPKRKIFEEEVDDDGDEPWETEDGVVAGPIKEWDNATSLSVEGEEMDQQLAFADKRIQPRPTPDNPTFLFTKCLTMPFFGSGIIELPPGGFKGQKNSRRFQFVFFVHRGKVAVNINGTRFVISKGGMFQVPRGNFYSIANESDHPAKLMFSQGCEVNMQQADESMA